MIMVILRWHICIGLSMNDSKIINRMLYQGKVIVNKESHITFFTDINSKSIEWLWYPYIPLGKITLVQGDPGDGKTTFILSLIAGLSNNSPLPCTEIKMECFSIYQNTEDDIEDTIKPRLESNNANCSRICFIDKLDEALTLDDERIEDAINKVHAKLVVLDPIQSFVGENVDMNRANSMRPRLNKLKEMAERTGCAVVLVGHFNKNSGGKVGYRGLGSIDIPAAARSVLIVAKTKEDDLRVLAQAKNNLAPIGKSLAFSLENGHVNWKGEYAIGLDELISGSSVESSVKLNSAIEIIYDLLSAGAKPSKVIFQECNKKGISKRTVNTAKNQIKIHTYKEADCWFWELKNE